MQVLVSQILPLLALVLTIVILLNRLPKVDLGYSKQFKFRRFVNWFSLGMTYAFLYMGRYNLAAAKNALGDAISNEEFGTIKSIGTIVYGVSFILNGPLTDKIGGRRTMLLAAGGSAICNGFMGGVLFSRLTEITS
ncbi:MAG: MFS transporter, partial [Sandaracinaceae bacterium]|nr:MFS transporter [Sandaracinaceae bacterium]